MSIRGYKPSFFGERGGYGDETSACAFKGCDRPRRQNGGYFCGIWCSGHEKQRQRHGLAKMKPLLEPQRRKR